jgi:probable rRNA maturation factor
MGKLVIECFDRKKSGLRKIAKAVYSVLGQKDRLKAELIYVDEEKMQTLNRDTRGVDKVTDVLSYPSLDGIRGEILKREEHYLETERRYLFIGSIVICDQKIREQAKEFGHSYMHERNYMIIHGLLHLFGYDHMTDEDKAEMRAKEKQILAVLKDTEE